MTDTEDEQPGGAPGGSAGTDDGLARDAGGVPRGGGVSGADRGAEGGDAAPAKDTQRLLANRYRLDSLLGRGSMGAVWKALDVVLGRSVAVKEVLLPPTQTDEENDIARERALREARSIAALSHPNVVTLYDVVEDDGRPWVVMELVPAKNLAEILKDDGTLPPTEAARIGLAVLAALNSAHEVGITHRDVKPGNILVSPDGRVKLADFGISRRAEDSALTRTGLMVGSPSYIAPEVARGRPATSAADIWGLGATLHCAVEGTPPFDLGDPVATLTAVVGDPPQPAPHAGPLQPLLARMLEKDPRDRIRPDEARLVLESILAARPVPQPTYAPPTGPRAPRSGATGRPGPPGAQPPPRPMAAGPMAAGAMGAGAGAMAAGAMGAGPRGGRPMGSGPMGSGPTGSGPTGSGPMGPGSGNAGGGAPGTGYHPRPQTGFGPAQPTSQGMRGPGAGQATSHTMRTPGAAYGAGTGQQPVPPSGQIRQGGQISQGGQIPQSGRIPQPQSGGSKRRGGNPWIAAVIGLLLAALIGGAVILWVSNDDDSGNGSSGTESSSPSILTPSVHPTSNNTTIEGTTASGAIQVSGVYRPFGFELPEGWEPVDVPADLKSGRSEFIESAGGTDPSTMVKVTVVAEPLDGDSADEHLQAQAQQIGSPSMLPGYSEISYEVTSQDNVLWQYESVLQGSERRGYLYATVLADDILWKILTSGPSDSGQATADVANDVIKTFTA